MDNYKTHSLRELAKMCMAADSGREYKRENVKSWLGRRGLKARRMGDTINLSKMRKADRVAYLEAEYEAREALSRELGPGAYRGNATKKAD